MKKTNWLIGAIAAIFVFGVIALYIFLIYTAVLALQHTDATVNVLGGILIAILINGIGNASNITKGGTGSRR
jgi:hypothetical protein